MHPRGENEMVAALLKMARRPTEHLVKKISEILGKERRQLGP